MDRVSGRKLAREWFARLKDEVSLCDSAPVLAIIYVGENPVIDSFVKLKVKKADKIGIETRVERFPTDASIDAIGSKIKELNADTSVDGIVVQLPLPDKNMTQELLNLVSPEKDVDVLSDESVRRYRFGMLQTMPPVAYAIDVIIKNKGFDLVGKKVAVVGKGRLVGEPVIDWLRLKRAEVTVFEDGDNLSDLARCEVVISGTGVAGLIVSDYLREDVILIDAGTSESAGVIKGDIHENAYGKALWYTPVPGGVGPLTVAALCQNVVTSQSITL